MDEDLDMRSESDDSDPGDTGSDWEVDGSQGRGPHLPEDDTSSSESEADDDGGKQQRPRLHLGKRRSTGPKRKG